MADILDELRHFAKGGAGDVSATCSDAAIEIERLRALIRVKALMMGMSEAEIAVLTGRQETP